MRLPNIVRATMLTAILLSFWSANLTAQEPRFSLSDTLKKYDLPMISKAVADWLTRNKGSKESLYIQAITESEARQAFQIYNQLVSKYPGDAAAELALFRMGQYYFSRGLYVSARELYLKLVESYPESEFADDAFYFAGNCLFASKKYQECYVELKSFLKRYPRSSLKDLVKDDLKEVESSPSFRREWSLDRVEGSTSKFAVQTGAFRSRKNANQMKQQLADLGYRAEVSEKDEQNATIYRVLLGSFTQKSEAKRFGTGLKRDHGMPFRVIELD